MAIVTTEMVLRYMKHMYQVEQDEIRTMRPMVDKPCYLVETLNGRTYEIDERTIMTREGVA